MLKADLTRTDHVVAARASLAAPREVQLRRVLWRVLVLNLLVAIAKLGVGIEGGVLSLLADGVHSLLDASSNVVGLVGLAIASRPPDRGHPYGHRRFETVAALVIGLLIGAGFLEIVQRVVDRLMNGGDPPQVSWAAAAVVVVTVLINLGVSRYELGKARELQSELLEADAKHTSSDAWAASAVLLGFGGIALGFDHADWIAATVVSAFIAVTAWRIVRSNLMVLTDEACLDAAEVYRAALRVPGVMGAHRIRSRGSSTHMLLDLHVHLDPHLTLTEAHSKTHQVMDELRATFPSLEDIVIHTEPADGRQMDRSKLAPGIESDSAAAEKGAGESSATQPPIDSGPGTSFSTT